MRAPHRRVLLFAAAFVPLLAAFSLAFPVVHGPYSRFLRGFVNAFAASLAPPLRVERSESGDWTVWQEDSEGLSQKIVTIPEKSLRQIHIGIVLLPPLLLATPVPFRRRLLLLGYGLAILVALQSVFHLALAWTWARYSVAERSGPVFQLVVMAHATAGQTLPVVIWGLLCWPYWFDRSPSSIGRHGNPSPGRAVGGDVARARDQAR